MSGVPSLLADLLAECDAHGIRLLLADDGGLTIDAPQDVLTPELLARLKAHKDGVLAFIEQFEERAAIMEGEVSTAEPPPELRRRVEATPDTWQNSDLTTTTEEICRCGGTTWRDVVLHDEPHRGRSTRRDCGRCGRFIDFPIWYGSD